MILHPVPPCRWRGRALEPGRFECSSTEATLAGDLATIAECRACQVRDHVGPNVSRSPNALAGAVRHLAYFVYPYGSEWQPNLGSLKQRLSLFNGRRLVTVATSNRTATEKDVADALAGADCEILPVANDPELREMAGYPKLMRFISPYKGEADCHWYAHAKGVTSAGWAPRVRDWREAMYEAQLDYWPLVGGLMKQFFAVGQFIRPRHIIPGSKCRFHFSGSFCWRRNAPLFARKWDSYDRHWCGSESHPGLVFLRNEVTSLYGERPTRGLDLYLDEVWQSGVKKSHDEWKAANERHKRTPILATVLLTSARQPVLVHEAITSVLNQSSDEWQLLVIDAGELSAAGAFDRYQEDARVSVFRTHETKETRSAVGIQAWAINRAMESGRVRGDVLLVLSDDDTFHPEWLSRVLQAARERPGEGAWVGSAQRVDKPEDGPGRVLGVLRADGTYGPGRTLRCVVDGMQLAVRRAAWRAWPEERAIAHQADGYWMDAVARETPVHALPFTVGQHRHTPGSTFTKAGITT